MINQKLFEQSNPPLHHSKRSSLPQPHLSHQLTKQRPLNYISQFFTNLNNRLPQISVPILLEKINKIRQVFSIKVIADPRQYLIKQYPKLSVIQPGNSFQILNQNSQKGLQRIDNFSYQLKWKAGEINELYFGELKGDIKQGYGIAAHFSFNSTSQSHFNFYQGYFLNNFKNGFGVELKDDDILMGQFVNNYLFSINRAIILYNNGDAYYGGAVNNKKSGRGCFLQSKPVNNCPNKLKRYQISARGTDYQQIIIGNWKDNKLIKNKEIITKITVKQILTQSIDLIDVNLMIKPYSIYCGNLIQIQQMQQIKGNQYSKDGKGLQFFYNGDFYNGQFKQGKPAGLGKYRWNNGDQYIGQFNEGKRQGNGIWKSISGQSFEGEFLNDKMNGYGIYNWHNGNKYEGQFKDGLRSGLGKMSWKNGQEFTGNWLKDVHNGKGQIKVKVWQKNNQKRYNFQNVIQNKMNHLYQRKKTQSQNHLKKSKVSHQSKQKSSSKYRYQIGKKQGQVKTQQNQQNTFIRRQKFEIQKQAFQRSRIKIQKHLIQLKKTNHEKLQEYPQNRKQRFERSLNLYDHLKNSSPHKYQTQIRYSNTNPLSKFHLRQSTPVNSQQALIYKQLNLHRKQSTPLNNEQSLIYNQTNADNLDIKNGKIDEFQSQARDYQQNTSKQDLTNIIHNLKKSKIILKKISKGRYGDNKNITKLGETLLKPIKWNNFQSSKQ